MEVATFVGVLGAVFGSFLNVVVYRLPRHESLVTPASHCPKCAAPVKPYDNIPILSWLLLRGHCRSCGSAISPRYPLVEALTAALCVGAVLAHHSAVTIALSVVLILLVVPAAVIDLEHRIIPNQITALGAVLAQPRAAHPQQLGGVESHHGGPGGPVLAERVDERHAVGVDDDARPLRGHVHDPGGEHQGARGDRGEVIAALHRQIDQVGDREQRPEPPDRPRCGRAEHLP